jgi:hypothetical protein
VVETICPDPTEHRRRVTTRISDLAGFTVPSWEQVQAVAEEYESRSDERLVLDTRRQLDACVQEVIDYLDQG